MGRQIHPAAALIIGGAADEQTSQLGAQRGGPLFRAEPGEALGAGAKRDRPPCSRPLPDWTSDQVRSLWAFPVSATTRCSRSRKLSGGEKSTLPCPAWLSLPAICCARMKPKPTTSTSLPKQMLEDALRELRRGGPAGLPRPLLHLAWWPNRLEIRERAVLYRGDLRLYQAKKAEGGRTEPGAATASPGRRPKKSGHRESRKPAPPEASQRGLSACTN